MDYLSPLHASRLRKHSDYLTVVKPRYMDRVSVTSEQREAFERIALGIFTDMTNAGCSLQETLSAIYLSGVMHAIELKG